MSKLNTKKNISIFLVIILTAGMFQNILGLDREKEITKNSIIIYVGSSLMYNNNEVDIIDESNPNVTPKIIDGKTYVPVNFVERIFVIL